MHSEVIVSLIQGPRAKMFRCSGAQLYRGPEVSRGVQRCPEVSRVHPGVETAASAALQFSTPVELGLRMLVGWLGGWLGGWS